MKLPLKTKGNERVLYTIIFDKKRSKAIKEIRIRRKNKILAPIKTRRTQKVRRRY